MVNTQKLQRPILFLLMVKTTIVHGTTYIETYIIVDSQNITSRESYIYYMCGQNSALGNMAEKL